MCSLQPSDGVNGALNLRVQPTDGRAERLVHLAPLDVVVPALGLRRVVRPQGIALLLLPEHLARTLRRIPRDGLKRRHDLRVLRLRVLQHRIEGLLRGGHGGAVLRPPRRRQRIVKLEVRVRARVLKVVKLLGDGGGLEGSVAGGAVRGLADREVEADIANHGEEERIEEPDDKQGLLEHEDRAELVAHRCILGVLVDEVLLRDDDHRAALDVEVRGADLAPLAIHFVRGLEAHVVDALGEHKAHRQLLDVGVVHHVTDEGDAEDEVRALAEEEIGRGKVVARVKIHLPPAKEREARANLKHGRVRLAAKVARGNVADNVAVVHVRGRAGEALRERAHGRHTVVASALEVVAAEGALKTRTRVLNLKRLLNRNVAPVGDLNLARHAADGEERRVVLKVNHDLRLLRRGNVLVGAVRHGRARAGRGRNLRERLDARRGQLVLGRLRLGGVRRVIVSAAGVANELLLGLRDLHGEGLLRLRDDVLDRQGDRVAGGKRLGEIHLVDRGAILNLSGTDVQPLCLLLHAHVSHLRRKRRLETDVNGSNRRSAVVLDGDLGRETSQMRLQIDRALHARVHEGVLAERHGGANGERDKEKEGAHLFYPICTKSTDNTADGTKVQPSQPHVLCVDT
eukprot:Opistho-1_new@103456